MDNGDATFESRLVTAAEFEDGTREEAADRAVAPFAIEDEGGVGEAERGRLDMGVARTVAML